jgi:hypothetical protein
MFEYTRTKNGLDDFRHAADMFIRKGGRGYGGWWKYSLQIFCLNSTPELV